MSAVATVAINVDARDATGQLRQLQGQAGQTEKAFSGLISNVQRLAGAYIGLRTAQEAFQAGIQRTESERRLTFLAKGYGEVAAAQEAAARAGRQFGLSATESNQQFAQLYGRLRPLNVALTDIEAAFVGFNTSAKVSGTTAAESAGALLQLTQALGSGVLRGQELNSVLEQAPGLVVALTKELGAPISQIRKLAEEGKITSDVVIRALKRAGDEGAEQLAEAMNGPAQAVKNLQNEFEDFQVAATEELIPALTDALKGLRDLLESLGPVIKGLGGIAAQTFGTVADLVNAITKPRATAAAIAIRGGRLPMAGLGGISGAGELFAGTSGAGGVGLTGLKAEAEQLARLRRQPVTKVLLELMQNRLARVEAPAAPTRTTAPPALQVGAVVGGGGSTRGGKAGGGGGGADLPAYISKDQLRQWLISQGFGRTTGDFTNRGHATPNHMLNAMDMGILGGSDAEALRRTSDMERRLRATGAFGDQLFGPISDPRGHGAGKGGQNIHLHIPTPGGMVKMNPALAALMGIKGAGQGGQFALAQGMADEDAKRLQLIEDSFRTGQQIEQQQNRQLANLQAQTPLEQSLLKIQQDYEDRAVSIGQLLDANQRKKLEGQNAALRELEIIKAQTDNLYRQTGLQKDITSEIGARAFAGAAGAFRTDINLDPLATTDPITEYSQRLKDLMDPINQAKAGATAIGAAFDDAFSSVIKGTQSTQEILSGFFKGIADSFLQMAQQMIAEMIKVYIFKQITDLFNIRSDKGGLFKGAGPVSGAAAFGAGGPVFNPTAFGAGVALRAMGGPVTAGQSYVVGERGPELFTPSSGGTITPNNRAGGGGVAVTVNVDAKGTSVEGNDQQAGQLGRVIAAAVQAELVNQKRRGGLLNP